MIGAIFAGIPPHIAVGVGGTIAMLGVVLEKWAAIRQVRRNGFALLFDAKRLPNNLLAPPRNHKNRHRHTEG